MDYYTYVIEVTNSELFTSAIRFNPTIKVLKIAPDVFFPSSVYSKTYQRFLNTKQGMFTIAGCKGIGKTTLIKLMGIPEKWIVDSDLLGRVMSLLYDKYSIKKFEDCAKFTNVVKDDVATTLINRFDDLNKNQRDADHIHSLYERAIKHLFDTQSPIIKDISLQSVINRTIPKHVVNAISNFLAKTVRQLIDPRTWDDAIAQYTNHLVQNSPIPKTGPVCIHFVHSSFELYSTIGCNTANLKPVMSPIVHIFSRSYMKDVSFVDNPILITDLILYACYQRDEQQMVFNVPISCFMNFLSDFSEHKIVPVRYLSS